MTLKSTRIKSKVPGFDRINRTEPFNLTGVRVLKSCVIAQEIILQRYGGHQVGGWEVGVHHKGQFNLSNEQFDYVDFHDWSHYVRRKTELF